MFKPITSRISYGGASIGLPEIWAVLKVMLSHGGKRWTLGLQSVLFERELAAKSGVDYAVVTNSGSSALLLATSALKLPPGSKIIIPALNFPTAYASLLQAGLTPVVVDCTADLLVDLEEVKKALVKYPETMGIVAVHIAGNSVDLVKLRRIVGDRYIISDNCIAEGSLVKTNFGDIPIEKIRIGDKVLTRNGYKKVVRVWNKGYQKVITKLGITATPEHRLITKKGEKELQYVNPSDILYQWNEKLSFIEEKTMSDIQMQSNGIEGSISGVVQPLIIGNFGLIILGKFLKDILYIIKTTILLIMSYPILMPLLQSNIPPYILQKKVGSISRKGIFLSQEKELLNGISPKQGNASMQNTINGFGLLGKSLQAFVRYVKKNIKLIGQNFVPQNATTRVFDLSVEEAHEFFVNGILVHNCDGFSSTINGEFIDSLADVSCVSFHAAHIITTGEGGAVLTNNKKLAETAVKMREWGRASGSDRLTKHEGMPEDYRERYVYDEIGYNLKPLELQCAMGRVQLKKLLTFKRKRQKNYKKLLQVFSPYPEFYIVKGSRENCWFGFPFLCVGIKRSLVMDYFESMNIETRTIFSGNILRHPAYKGTGIQFGDLEISNYVMERGVFISNHPSLTDKHIEFISQAVRGVVGLSKQKIAY